MLNKPFAFLVCLFFLCNFAWSVGSCSPFPLKANYTVKTIKDDKVVNQYPLIIWRNKSSVIYDYPALKLADKWVKTPNNRLELSRYFHEFKRAIDYDAADVNNIGNSRNWNTLYNLIAINNLQKHGETGSKCEQRVALSNNNNLKVSLLKQWGLPEAITFVSNNMQQQYILTTIANTTALPNYLAKLAAYDATDFADIGDNEADPFLAEMINMGFIEHGGESVYDASGKQIDHGHHAH